jgi:manganese/zinc/iron transport system permease protein
MMSAQTEVQLVAVVIATACAIPGVFLVLRRMAMMSDAISHTVLFGIVIGFFVTHNLGSPWLFVGAVLTGVLTVSLVELLNRTRLVKQDAAIGLVFPVLFSLAVILISRFAGNVHLDTDVVLMGELAFVPFDRVVWLGVDLGPRALVVGVGLVLLNLAFVTIFYKELKLATFDAGLAAAFGFMPGLLHYGLMALVSVTAVGAFDAVGSILVVALMIAPPAAAYLLTDRLPRMIGLSILIGAASAIAGYWLARQVDVSIAGSMATMSGVAFGLVFLLAPERGVLAGIRRRTRQKWTFAQQLLTAHLLNHETDSQAAPESRVEHLTRHMLWAPAFATRVVRRAERSGLLQRRGDTLILTERGRQMARQVAGI